MSKTTTKTEIPQNERKLTNAEELRLKTLKDLNILDTANEIELDEIVQIAVELCDVPIALISLVDENRQWFKAKIGLDANETPRNISFCTHAIEQENVFVVNDASTDDRFSKNPLVLNDPNIRFYAGAPLKMENGCKIGTLCVIDKKSRSFNQAQQKALEVLAKQVVKMLQLRMDLNHATYGSGSEFFRLSLDLFCVATIDGFFVELNPMWEKTLGWTVEELKSKPFIDFIHPNDRQATIEAAANIGNGHDIVQFTNRYQCKDGGFRWLSWNANLSKTKNLIYGVARDITESRKQEDELKTLFEFMGEGIVVQSKAGQIFRFNKAALDLLGLSENQLLGRSSFDPRWRAIREDGSDFPGGDHPAMVALQTGQAQLGVIMGVHLPNGSLNWISINAIPLFQNQEKNPYQVLCTFRNVTETRKSGELLKATNDQITSEKKKFEVLVHALNSSAIVAITDRQGNITFANDNFCEISGYTLHDLLGKNHRILNSGHHPKDYFTNLWKTLKQGNIWRGEICNKKKNGELYWVYSTIMPLPGSNPEDTQYIAIRFDITARKNIEQALVLAKNAEERANKAKSDFLAMISHEIRTPINGVLGRAVS